ASRWLRARPQGRGATRRKGNAVPDRGITRFWGPLSLRPPRQVSRVVGWLNDSLSLIGGCVFLDRSRTPEPTLIIEGWFLSGCYRKAGSDGVLSRLGSDRRCGHVSLDLSQGGGPVIHRAGRRWLSLKISSPE